MMLDNTDAVPTLMELPPPRQAMSAGRGPKKRRLVPVLRRTDSHAKSNHRHAVFNQGASLKDDSIRSSSGLRQLGIHRHRRR